MRKVLKFFISKYFIYGLLIGLQALFMLMMIVFLYEIADYLYILLFLLSTVILLWLFQMKMNSSYKMAWAILIVLFPLLGGLWFVLWYKIKLSGKQKKTLAHINKVSLGLNRQDEGVLAALAAANLDLSAEATYLLNEGKAPVFANCKVEYFALGEAKYQRMLEELKKAEKFIFIEYFIINEGQMWGEISKILVAKAQEGVEVRLMYDAFGTLNGLSDEHLDYLEDNGISIVIFNPLRPVLDGFVNSRDHRKICVIDGLVAFNGGVNLSDEYINRKVRFGHWKDTAVMLRGEAVRSFTLMFLQMWQFATHEKENYSPYLVAAEVFAGEKGFVQPFGDEPTDHNYVGQHCYINLINRAKKYIYITTPYLVLDAETELALCLAASSGVDVRIVMPGIPDKKSVFLVSRSYYSHLLSAGVKIYEYKPGFIHSKMLVSDDVSAVVGTANLDFRSLYLHYECCTAFYLSPICLEVKQDILDTIILSELVDYQEIKNQNKGKIIIQAVLRVFSPFL